MPDGGDSFVSLPVEFNITPSNNHELNRDVKGEAGPNAVRQLIFPLNAIKLVAQ